MRRNAIRISILNIALLFLILTVVYKKHRAAMMTKKSSFEFPKWSGKGGWRLRWLRSEAVACSKPKGFKCHYSTYIDPKLGM